MSSKILQCSLELYLIFNGTSVNFNRIQANYIYSLPEMNLIKAYKVSIEHTKDEDEISKG